LFFHHSLFSHSFSLQLRPEFGFEFGIEIGILTGGLDDLKTTVLKSSLLSDYAIDKRN